MRKNCSQASLVSSAESAAIYSLLKNSATYPFPAFGARRREF